MTHGQLEQLARLLRHEAAECQRLADKPALSKGRPYFQHKRQNFLLVHDWLRDLAAGGRPGAGAYSPTARAFHKHGQPLPPLDEDAFRVALDGGADK